MMQLWRSTRIHERFFGAFILLTLLRLLWAVGPFSPHTLVYMGSAALMAGGVLLTRGRETSCRWRLRLAIYPILMDALFPHMRWVSPSSTRAGRTPSFGSWTAGCSAAASPSGWSP